MKKFFGQLYFCPTYTVVYFYTGDFIYDDLILRVKKDKKICIAALWSFFLKFGVIVWGKKGSVHKIYVGSFINLRICTSCVYYFYSLVLIFLKSLVDHYLNRTFVFLYFYIYFKLVRLFKKNICYSFKFKLYFLEKGYLFLKSLFIILFEIFPLLQSIYVLLQCIFLFSFN